MPGAHMEVAQEIIDVRIEGITDQSLRQIVDGAVELTQCSG